MNTFLPHHGFRKSAEALDSIRANKQIAEVKQIIMALTSQSQGYAYHPATLMWEGYVPALAAYGRAVCMARVGYGHPQHEYWQFLGTHAESRYEVPWWFGNRHFHESHQHILWKKDPMYYQAFAPQEGFDTRHFPVYIWPVKYTRYDYDSKTKSFWVRKKDWRKICQMDKPPSGLTDIIRVGKNWARYLLQEV